MAPTALMTETISSLNPILGLQANTDKYGVDGSGGVDGSETVPGLHKVGTGHHGVTDWDAIKKADTPY